MTYVCLSNRGSANFIRLKSVEFHRLCLSRTHWVAAGVTFGDTFGPEIMKSRAVIRRQKQPVRDVRTTRPISVEEVERISEE